MAEALSRGMNDFMESVLRLQPKLAAFDCDGTLWSGDAGESFFWWELDNGLVSDEITRWARARYADYKAGKVSEAVMCGEMVTLHKGLPEARIQLRGVGRLVEQPVDHPVRDSALWNRRGQYPDDRSKNPERRDYGSTDPRAEWAR